MAICSSHAVSNTDAEYLYLNRVATTFMQEHGVRVQGCSEISQSRQDSGDTSQHWRWYPHDRYTSQGRANAGWLPCLTLTLAA